MFRAKEVGALRMQKEQDRAGPALEALPPAELGAYRGLRSARRPIPVTAAQEAERLRLLRQKSARWLPQAGPAARRDRVTLDFAGFWPDGAPIPDSRAENVTVILGGGGLLPGAEEALCGRCAGEQVTLPFTYPSPFRVPELAGRAAVFTLFVRRVERSCLPDADDAFARAAGAEDLAALRRRLRAECEREALALARRAAGAELLDQAAQNLRMTLPDALVAPQAAARLERWKAALAAQYHTAPEEYFRLRGTTEEAELRRLRAERIQELRRRAAVREIARAEGLTVSDAEIAAEYARLARREGKDAAPWRALRPEAVREALLSEKVRAFLLESAAEAPGKARPAGEENEE